MTHRFSTTCTSVEQRCIETSVVIIGRLFGNAANTGSTKSNLRIQHCSLVGPWTRHDYLDLGSNIIMAQKDVDDDTIKNRFLKKLTTILLVEARHSEQYADGLGTSLDKTTGNRWTQHVQASERDLVKHDRQTISLCESSILENKLTTMLRSP